MNKLRRSVSGLMSRNIEQLRAKSSETNGEIPTQMVTPEDFTKKTENNYGLGYKQPLKRRTFCCIIELAGVSFVILLLTPLMVLLLVSWSLLSTRAIPTQGRQGTSQHRAGSPAASEKSAPSSRHWQLTCR